MALQSDLELLAEIKKGCPDKQKVIILLKKARAHGLYIHYACRAGWYDVSMQLIQLHGLQSLKVLDNNEGATPLHFACTSGNIELVQYLISECSCDPLCVSSKDSLSVLHCAIMGGLPVVKYLLEDCGLRQLLDIGKPEIMLFAFNNWDNKLMKYLIVEHKCSIIVNASTGSTVLHSACRDGDINKLKFLIKDCGCSAYVCTNKNETVLHTLCSLSCYSTADLDIMSYLCEKFQFKPLVRNFAGYTAVDYAIMSRDASVAMVHILLRHCPPLNASVCAHIMSIAYYYWNDSVMKYLITEKCLGIITNVKTGNTVLHNACRDMSIRKLRFLVEECQCNPNVVHKEKLAHAFSPSFCQPIDSKVLLYFHDHDYNPLLASANSFKNTPVECANAKEQNGLISTTMNNQSKLLCNAVRCRNLTTIQRLIEKEKILSQIHNSVEIMSLAYDYWDNAVIKCLILEAKFSIIINTDTGDTMLHKTCSDELNALLRLKFLVEDCHCSPHVTNKIGESLLHSVCRSASNNFFYPTIFQKLQFLCLKCKCFSELTSSDIIFALKCSFLQEEKGLPLICHFIENYTEPVNVVNVMSLATFYWDEAILKCLIVEKALEITIDDDTGSTVLHRACQNVNLKQLKFLLEDCKCSPYIVNNNHETLLHTLCKSVYFSNKHTDLLYYLCDKYDFDIHNPTDNNGNTFLHTLCDSIRIGNYITHVNTLYYFFNHFKCDGNVRNNNGFTILHQLCSKLCYNIEIVKLVFNLIKEGKCDPLIEDSDSNTILDILISTTKTYSYDVLSLIHFIQSFSNADGNTHLSRNYVPCDEILHILCDNISFENNNTCISFLNYFLRNCKYDTNYRNENGLTILHQLCSKCYCGFRVTNLVYYLIKEGICDPLMKDLNYNTILHIIVSTTKIYSPDILSLVHFIIDDRQYDVLSFKNADGNTPLHLACQHFSGDISVIEYILSTGKADSLCLNKFDVTPLMLLEQSCQVHELEIVKVILNLLKEGKCDPEVVKVVFNLIKEGKCDPEVVNKVIFNLIKEGKCDPLKKDSDSNSILHILISGTKTYSLDVLSLIYFIIDECGVDISSRNANGDTPLHLACKHFSGNISVIEYILSTGKADPLCLNKHEETPLMLLEHSCFWLNDERRVRQLIDRFGEVQIAHPINSFVNIVLLGDPGVGKSSLTKVIEERNNYAFPQFRNVKGVELCTAGIIPNILNDKDLGRVIIHDLAGHAEYYSSHTAVLENLLQGSAAVFIIVVSLADANFFQSFHRWLTIVENVSHNSFYQCQLLVAVSHIDQPLGNKTNNVQLLKQELDCFVDVSGLCSQGISTLDCRKLGGSHLSSLISKLSTACQSISKSSTKEMSLYCHMIYDFFQHNKQITVCTLENLVQTTKESNELFLPKNIDLIHGIISTLSTTGLIVYLGSERCVEKSWVVVDKSILLSDLDGVLFAPNDFKQHAHIASNTGVVKLSDLFSLFPKYDSELLLRFLQYTELGQVISKKFMSLTNIKPLTDEVEGSTSDDEEQYMFVPALIQVAEKPKIEEPFKFGWCLQCNIKKHQFFIPRFLHLLLLHLAYKFSVRKYSSNAIELLCEIWTKGIYWKDTDGVQTLVELDDTNQLLILLVSCHEESALTEMIKDIKKVIIEILTCKQQVMPRAVTREYILDNSHLQYPLPSALSGITLFDTELLAKCYINNKQFILNTTGEKQVTIAKLFFAEQPTTNVVKLCCEAVFAGRDPKCLAKGDSKIAMVNEQTFQNEDTKQDPKIQSEKIPAVMKEYAPKIIALISEPSRLGNDLCGVDLITTHFRNYVTENIGTYEKSSMLVNEAIKVFYVFEQDLEDRFSKFCFVLRQQQSLDLCTIVEEMIYSVSQQ